MFTSLGDEPSGTDFSDLGEDDEFTWHQFYVVGLKSRDFEGHAPDVMHNDTGWAVPLTWLLLDNQLTVELIAKPIILLNIRKVRSEDAIRVHCNSGVKVVYRVSELPGYGTVWYELTGIANILSMSRATKKFWVIFDSEGGNFQDGPTRQGGDISTQSQRNVLFKQGGQVEQRAPIKHVVRKQGKVYMEVVRGGSGGAESSAPTGIPVGAGL